MPNEVSDQNQLPMCFTSDNKRDRLLNMYAALVWRHTNIQKIAALLKDMYETAYSDGMLAMDRMHTIADNQAKTP